MAWCSNCSVQEAQAHKDEVASDDEDIASILGDGGGGGSRSREAGGGRKTLDAAAIDVIARPSTPKVSLDGVVSNPEAELYEFEGRYALLDSEMF